MPEAGQDTHSDFDKIIARLQELLKIKLVGTGRPLTSLEVEQQRRLARKLQEISAIAQLTVRQEQEREQIGRQLGDFRAIQGVPRKLTEAEEAERVKLTKALWEFDLPTAIKARAVIEPFNYLLSPLLR